MTTPASPAVESAPAAPVAAATVATAPANAAPASDAPQRKPGFFARLTGEAARAIALESECQTLRTTNAALTADLATVRAELTSYQQMESQLEAAENARVAALATASAATTAAAAVPQQVAAGVVDAMASLGVESAALPPIQAAPPAAGQGSEFGQLTGRERAAAAFNAQINPA